MGNVRSDVVLRSTRRQMMEQRINSRMKILPEIVKQTKQDITFPPLPAHCISSYFFLIAIECKPYENTGNIDQRDHLFFFNL